MSILVRTCPSCLGEKMAFVSQAEVVQAERDTHTVFFMCPGCRGGLVAEVISTDAARVTPHTYGPNLEGDRFIVQRTYPEPNETEIPDHLPENIGKFFFQAKEAYRRHQYDGAGMLCRKVLETSAKRLDPTFKGNLWERIESLVKAGTLTAAMGEWAHVIRDDGNGASHEEEPTTAQEAEDLVNFTEMFVMYVFTMPGMINEKRAAKEQR